MIFRRKKPEFKADSRRFDLAQQLYMSPQQQRRYLKWILLSLLSVFLLVLQDVLFSRMSLYGATVDMVPCVLLLIPFFGTFTAAFRQAYLRKGFRTTMMCSGAALILYETLSFLAALLLGVTRLARWWVMGISTGLTLLTLPLVFVLVWGICTIGGDQWKE